MQSFESKITCATGKEIYSLQFSPHASTKEPQTEADEEYLRRCVGPIHEIHLRGKIARVEEVKVTRFSFVSEREARLVDPRNWPTFAFTTEMVEPDHWIVRLPVTRSRSRVEEMPPGWLYGWTQVFVSFVPSEPGEVSGKLVVMSDNLTAVPMGALVVSIDTTAAPTMTIEELVWSLQRFESDLMTQRPASGSGKILSPGKIEIGSFKLTPPKPKAVE